jgi:hypothetical protein
LSIFATTNRKAYLDAKSHPENCNLDDFLPFWLFGLRLPQQPIEIPERLAFPQSPQADPQYLVVNTSLKTTP